MLVHDNTDGGMQKWLLWWVHNGIQMWIFYPLGTLEENWAYHERSLEKQPVAAGLWRSIRLHFFDDAM